MPTQETETNGVGPAAKQVAEHASSLARLELELAVLELKKKVANLGIGIGLGAGGLLFVYDPNGSLRILRPTTGATAATLPAGAGHWNSPIVVAGRIALPEGNANDHRVTGVLNIYRLP